MVVVIPRVYADWSSALERFAQGGDDESVLHAMRQGQLDWTPGVATLFSERINEVFDQRLKALGSRLDRSFKYCRDEVDVVRALLDARRQLTVLHWLASLEVLPEVLRSHLQALLQKAAQAMQQSLEDGARSQRSDALLRTLRQQDLRHFQAAMPVPVPAAGEPPPSSVPSKRRSFLV